MNILVTGASGFIGSAFTRLALRQGHSVAGLFRSTPVKVPMDQPGLTRIQGSLESPDWSTIKQFAPEACVHCAWIATPGIYLESPLNHQYLLSSRALIDRLAKFGLRHLIALGTCVEYEPQQNALSEHDSPVIPSTLYARCKDELRRSIEQETAHSGFAACWARLFYPYGPGEHPQRLCSILINAAFENRELVLKTPNSIKDYIFIEDVAAALCTILDYRYSGTVNIGTGTGISVRRFVETVGELVGQPIRISSPPAVDAPKDYVVADSAKIRSLGWKPDVDLSTGILRQIEAMKQNR